MNDYHENMHHHPAISETSQAGRDPVCGMQVDPEAAAHRTVHAGTTYVFCSYHCLERFSRDPERYPGEAETPPKAAAGEIYTCPMHPEIEQHGPGACPTCGMALEPMMVTEEEAADPELQDMTRRFWVSVVLTLPVVLLAMGDFIGLPVHAWIDPRPGKWLEFILATPVVLWGGKPFFVRGYSSIRTMHLNMFTLIGLGTGVAWLYSLVATLAPGLFPAAFRTAAGMVPVYFEAAAVIVTLVLLGQMLELRARRSTAAYSTAAPASMSR